MAMLIVLVIGYKDNFSFFPYRLAPKLVPFGGPLFFLTVDINWAGPVGTGLDAVFSSPPVTGLVTHAKKLIAWTCIS